MTKRWYRIQFYFCFCFCFSFCFLFIFVFFFMVIANWKRGLWKPQQHFESFFKLCHGDVFRKKRGFSWRCKKSCILDKLNFNAVTHFYPLDFQFNWSNWNGWAKENLLKDKMMLLSNTWPENDYMVMMLFIYHFF